MRKFLCVFMCAALLISCAACGSKTVTGSTAPDTTELSVSQQTEGIDATTGYESIITTSPPESQADTGRILTGESGAATLSGYSPLTTVKYEVSDPDNIAGLSTAKISHSHGPASDGEAHYTVVGFQRTFDKYGALTLDNTSDEKTLYLTFDCGWENDNLTADVLDTLKEKDVPAAFFCTLTHIKQQPELIARMIEEGHIVGNHSATHPSFSSITRAQMVEEIELTENYLRENFGYAAKYFRFPAGEYNESALELIDSLGYMSVFWSLAYDDWDVNTVRGADYTIDVVMKRMHPGAVILLHSVSHDNAQALGEIIDKARAEGYVFRSLEEYRSD